MGKAEGLEVWGVCLGDVGDNNGVTLRPLCSAKWERWQRRCSAAQGHCSVTMGHGVRGHGGGVHDGRPPVLVVGTAHAQALGRAMRAGLGQGMQCRTCCVRSWSMGCCGVCCASPIPVPHAHTYRQCNWCRRSSSGVREFEGQFSVDQP